MKKLLFYITPSVIFLSPLLVAAQDLGGTLDTIEDLLNQLIPLLLILATVLFLWGVIRYVTAGGDEEKLKTGRQYMLWGLIGLAVMVAVWGIVKLLVNTFGVGGEGVPPDIGVF